MLSVMSLILCALSYKVKTGSLLGIMPGLAVKQECPGKWPGTRAMMAWTKGKVNTAHRV